MYSNAEIAGLESLAVCPIYARSRTCSSPSGFNTERTTRFCVGFSIPCHGPRVFGAETGWMPRKVALVCPEVRTAQQYVRVKGWRVLLRACVPLVLVATVPLFRSDLEPIFYLRVRTAVLNKTKALASIRIRTLVPLSGTPGL